jgi:NAD(P)H dehydrogenase (quinone)
MTITVTAATGQLGPLVVRSLLDRGVPASDIVVAVRDPKKAAPLADLGVGVRHGDYARPDTLKEALAGTERLVFISGSEAGQRTAQHRNVVDAAVAAGVSLVAYTSFLRADTSTIPLSVEHRETEAMIREAGLPYVFLRHSWYVENYTGGLDQTLERGVILGAAGDGRVSAATRADYAAAAAAVVTGDGHAGRAYELGADEPFSMTELAEEITRQTGRPVRYQDLPADEYASALVSFGLPEGYANALAAADVGLSQGQLETRSGDLARLIGRPTTTLAEAIAVALQPAAL